VLGLADGRMESQRLFVAAAPGRRVELRDAKGWASSTTPFGGLFLSAGDQELAGSLLLASPPPRPLAGTLRVGRPQHGRLPFQLELTSAAAPLLDVRLRDWPAGVPLRLADAGQPLPALLRRDGAVADLRLNAAAPRERWLLRGSVPVEADGQATLPQPESSDGQPPTLRLEGASGPAPKPGEKWRVAPGK
jgi:hypothetical protein